MSLELVPDLDGYAPLEVGHLPAAHLGDTHRTQLSVAHDRTLVTDAYPRIRPHDTYCEQVANTLSDPVAVVKAINTAGILPDAEIGVIDMILDPDADAILESNS